MGMESEPEHEPDGCATSYSGQSSKYLETKIRESPRKAGTSGPNPVRERLVCSLKILHKTSSMALA